MTITYTLDDWIRDRLNHEQSRIDAAIAHGELIIHALTSTDPNYVAPPSSLLIVETPSLHDENDWHRSQWLKAQINFGR